MNKGQKRQNGKNSLRFGLLKESGDRSYEGNIKSEYLESFLALIEEKQEKYQKKMKLRQRNSNKSGLKVEDITDIEIDNSSWGWFIHPTTVYL